MPAFLTASTPTRGMGAVAGSFERGRGPGAVSTRCAHFQHWGPMLKRVVCGNVHLALATIVADFGNSGKARIVARLAIPLETMAIYTPALPLASPMRKKEKARELTRRNAGSGGG